MSELGDRMRALAQTGHPRAEELRALATEFDVKTEAHYGPDGNSSTARSMLGAWARARMLLRECTGEPLV